MVYTRKEFGGDIVRKVTQRVNLTFLPAEPFIVLIGHENMTWPPMGGNHDRFTQSSIGDFLPLSLRILGRDGPGFH